MNFDIWVDKQIIQRTPLLVSWIRHQGMSKGKLIMEGLSLNYWNVLISTEDTPLIDEIQRLKKIPGIYINEYPPEIKTELEEY